MGAVSDQTAIGHGARSRTRAEGGLHLRLDFPLPTEIAVGAGNAVFVCGWCFSPPARIRSLALVVDGDVQPVMAHGMPRLDVIQAFHPRRDPYETANTASDPSSPDDPHLHAYRSGFWAIGRIRPHEGRAHAELLLRAELEGGGEAVAELARIRTIERPEAPELPAPPSRGRPLVAICMATYEPPVGLLRRQVESIRVQSHADWICLVSDDCSSPGAFAALQDVVGDDARFVVSRSPRRLGFYHNFERALAMVPAGVPYVALADQDDVWHSDKLETLLAELGHAKLVYSDARIISQDGRVLAETYWERRRNNHSDLLSLLVANSVTGAASLMRREVLDYALPFPPAQFTHFHDHWIGLTALALGDIAFTDRPVYDYVQHGEASLGHAAANQMPSLRARLAAVRRDPHERVRQWRGHYFTDVCRLIQFATVLTLRCGERMAPGKHLTLDRFLRTERSLPSLARLALRGAREILGPGRPETLGAEWLLFHSFNWRRALGATTRDRPRRGLRLDALPPPTLAPRPGRRAPEGRSTRAIVDKIAPLDVEVRDDAPPRVNLLVPTIDLEHFFGGYIAKFNLARRLAARGVRVRIVTVDPVGALRPSWQRELEGYSGLAGLFDDVEVLFGRASHTVEVSPADSFIATTWWTAHIADVARRRVGGERFLYLIQEYEPFTFEMGTYAALAAESYRFPHFGLFSTELLRDYFRRHAIGVYAAGRAAGEAASVTFQNAITAVSPPSSSELAGRAPRRLLFYARPEPHAARNMFELGVLALGRALEDGAFQDGWELHGIGTVDSARRIDLGGGASLELLPRSAQDAYATVLRDHDVGLALMYTPHPSLVPIEMASAGMVTVTNSFENKTPEALAAISTNLLTAEPTIAGVAAGLRRAEAGVADVDRRVRGSDVPWSRDWDESFDDDVLARVAGFLAA